MSDSQTPSTIHDVFPLVPEDALPGLLVGLTARDAAEELATHGESDSAFANIADWMLRHPSSCLGSMLPGLWLARDTPINSPDLAVRNLAALSRLSLVVWGDVLELTPSHLIDIQGFGEGCLRPFLTVAASVATEACCLAAPPKTCPTVDAFEPRRFTPRLGFRVSEFKRLADWAMSEKGAVSVADLLAACAASSLPDDIALLSDALRTMRLDEVVGFAPTESIEKLVTDLCGVLDKRMQTIFLARISLNNQRTLDDLATELGGITKERVRQVSVKAEEKIREALRSSRFTRVVWRAHSLSTMLGAAIPRGPQLENAFNVVANGVSDAGRERVLDLLLWLAGPYSWESSLGWLCKAEVPDRNVLESCSDERGRVDLDRVRSRLAEVGLLPDAQTTWIEQVGRVKFVEGSWLLWDGSVPDKAFRLLEIWGEPATPEQIVDAIGEGHDLKASRNRLFDDERFMRVDMNRIGLRSWGLEEYSSIAEEIDQELERRGGPADIDDVVSTLVSRFSLREASVWLYVTAPMFVIEGSTVRRRTTGDPLPAVQPVTEIPDCYLLGPDSLVWRMDISTETLRGSGRLLPSPIGAWLGVLPGGRLSLAANGGTVRVTWPGTSPNGPSLGSVRFLAEALNAQPGDQGLLCFHRDSKTIALTVIDREAMEAAQGLRRLSLLTGIPHADGDAGFLHALGVALGTRGTRAAVCAELMRRGEHELASLIPPESVSPDLDAAIDAMRDLF
jgi:hypothetical protein